MSRRIILKAAAAGALALATSTYHAGSLGRRHHQGGHFALPVGHHGHFRNVAERCGADDDRRDQCQGRRAGQEAGSRRRRSRVELALFAEKARQLVAQDKVAVVFGCWTSVSRKSVLPVFKELNSLLFYPVQYEGEELEKNVFYTGAAPNQQAIPAVEYLMSKDGGGAKRFVLLGTDYVYPRTTNKILRAFLKSKGVKDSDISEVYTPFGHADYQTIVANIKKFSTGGKTAVISTINGDSNVPFYKELGNAGLKATDVPVVAFSVGEEELRGIDTKPLLGHLAAWNYFESVKNPVNTAFIKQWKAYAVAQKLPNAGSVVTNDPMEATYVGIHMWAQAVEKAKSTDTDKVIAAMAGQSVKAPSGFTLTMDATNHHLHKPVMIGEIKADGQFNVVWKTKEPIRAQPWSPYIKGNEGKQKL